MWRGAGQAFGYQCRVFGFFFNEMLGNGFDIFQDVTVIFLCSFCTVCCGLMARRREGFGQP